MSVGITTASLSLLTLCAVLVEEALVLTLVLFAQTLVDLMKTILMVLIAHGTPNILTGVVYLTFMISEPLSNVVLVYQLKLVLNSNQLDMLAIWILKIEVAIHVHGTQAKQSSVVSMTL